MDTMFLCFYILITHLFCIVYSMAPAEVVDPLIYDGLVEELIEVLEIKNTSLQVRTLLSKILIMFYIA